jgi:putative membrane protein
MEIGKRTCKPLVASLALLFASTIAFGQASTTTPTNGSNESGTTMQQTTRSSHTSTSTATTSTSDAQFAKEASQANLGEIKLGQLAQQKGTNTSVRDFGQQMVTDHQNAQDKLKDAAQKDNITLPTTLSAKDQATYDRLSKLSGSQFDKAYAQDMVKDHTTDVAKFKHEASSGKSASIKSFASQTLPTLQQHLNMAKQMSQTVSASNTTNGTAKPTS